jgi:hypothetical protein
VLTGTERALIWARIGDLCRDIRELLIIEAVLRRITGLADHEVLSIDGEIRTFRRTPKIL